MSQKLPARRDRERALRVERPERKMPQGAKPVGPESRAAAKLARRARTVGSNFLSIDTRATEPQTHESTFLGN
jgi:hypothetical protein